MRVGHTHWVPLMVNLQVIAPSACQGTTAPPVPKLSVLQVSTLPAKQRLALSVKAEPSHQELQPPVQLAHVAAVLAGPSLPSTVHQLALIAARATLVQRLWRPSVPRGHTPLLDPLSALSVSREATPSQAHHHALSVKKDTTARRVLSYRVRSGIGPLPKHRAAPSVELAGRVPPLKRLYVLMAVTL